MQIDEEKKELEVEKKEEEELKIIKNKGKYIIEGRQGIFLIAREGKENAKQRIKKKDRKEERREKKEMKEERKKKREEINTKKEKKRRK